MEGTGTLSIAVANYAANASIQIGLIAGAASGFAAGVSVAAFDGQSSGNSIRSGIKGAVAGAISGGYGGYLKNNGYNSRVARGISGGINGAIQRGNVGGFLRGFAAGQLSVDLGVKSFYTNPFANFAISRGRDALQGYVVDGKSGAKRNAIGGAINDVVGHVVGLATAYQEHGKFKAPKFRDGLYFYDSGNGIRKFGPSPITLGNVVSGPRELYDGSYQNDTYGRWLDEHERRHYIDQSALGASYVPVQMLSQWGAFGVNKLGFSVNPFLEYSPFHSLGYETAP